MTGRQAFTRRPVTALCCLVTALCCLCMPLPAQAVQPATGEEPTSASVAASPAAVSSAAVVPTAPTPSLANAAPAAAASPFLPAKSSKHKAQSKKMLCGITLDCSNRYYSVSQLKEYIRLAAKSGSGYIQLHLTGDAGVGIQCDYLGQKPSKKHVHGKSRYYNPKTGRSFLTKAQVRSVLKYAKKKGVEVVPEIDMPGHMGGFQALYAQKYGKKKAARVFDASYGNELRIGSKQGMAFAKAIYREYAKLFKGCKRFHIGCDEFWSGSPQANATYINAIAKYLRGKGFEVWCWNDLIVKSNVKKISKKVRVTYWSWDGDAGDSSTAASRREQRATFPQLLAAGFKVLNYNSYYLYYVPSKAASTDANYRYMVRDAKKHWNPRTWDADSGKKAKSSRGIVGACVSVWGEDSRGVGAQRIYHDTAGLYRAMAANCK